MKSRVFAWGSVLGRFILVCTAVLLIGCGGETPHGDSAWLPQSVTTPSPPVSPDSACTFADHGAHQYWFCSDRREVEIARGKCRSIGMDLVSIDDADENAFVHARISKTSAIGLRKSQDGASWNWVADGQPGWCPGASGSNGSPANGAYTNWHTVQPKGSGDCAEMEAQSGEWSSVRCTDTPVSFVCESVDTAAVSHFQAETTSVEYVPRSLAIASFHTGPNASVVNPFLRYRKEIGLRDCIDTVAVPRAFLDSRTSSGSEVGYYGQFYRGVRVAGHGFLIERSKAGGFLQSVLASFASHLNLSVQPSVSEKDALKRALQSANALRASPSTKGQLVVFPRGTAQARTFRLAWSFSLLQGTETFIVVVDALDGQILQVVSALESVCDSVDTSTPGFTATQVLGVADTSGNGGYDGTSNITQYDSLSGAQHLGLLNKGLLNAPAAGFTVAPLMYVTCPGNDFPRVTTIPDLREQASSPWDADKKHAFQLHTALQRCVEYFETLSFAVRPWIGIDGTGVAKLPIRLDPLIPNGGFVRDFNNPAAAAFGWHPDFANGDLSIACHEYGHGVAFWQAAQLGQLQNADPAQNPAPLEAEAVQEGFADVTGAAARDFVLDPDGTKRADMWCIGGDSAGRPLCLRDLAHPTNSGPITINGISVGSSAAPDTYGGTDYCANLPMCVKNQKNQPVPCCDEHIDGVVFGHWFYLLTTGTNGQSLKNGVGCQYKVDPIDLDKAMNIAAAAMGTKNVPGANFLAVATATIEAAKAQYTSAEVNSVVQAWYAVNVWDKTWSGLQGPMVSPPRGATDVSPWVALRWANEPPAGSWDIEITASTDSVGAPDFSRAVVSITTTVNATTDTGIFENDIALSSKAGPFYWRVKPSTESSFDCFPVYVIASTGDLPAVKNVHVTDTIADDGVLVRPGVITAQWDRVEGATKYQVYVGARGAPNCLGTAVATSDNGQHGSTPGSVLAFVDDIQPSESTYWVAVQPIGPNDPTNTPATGSCVGAAFATTAARPPYDLGPNNAPTLYQRSALTWQWKAYDHPDSFEIKTFTRDSLTGACGDSHLEPPGIITTTGSCPDFFPFCSVAHTEDFFPTPNASGPWADPAGYCWSVASVYKNGKRTTSDKVGFPFFLAPVSLASPGIAMVFSEFPNTYHKSMALTDHKEGDPITLRWNLSPNASGYTVKLARWPWRARGSPIDPPNCLPSWCGDQMEPASAAYHQEAAGLSATISADVIAALPRPTGAGDDLGGAGRFCWAVWPTLESPTSPGQGTPSSVQPLVEMDPLCYTTEPPKPKISFDKDLPSEQGFTAGEINGTITFPYLPAGLRNDCELKTDKGDDVHSQCVTDVPKHVETDPSDWTPDENWIYDDRYECACKFTITLHEGTTYTVIGTASGENEDATETKTFKTGSCGGAGEPCCEGNKCDSDRTNCDNGTCSPCGGEGLECCTQGTVECDGSAVLCSGGICNPCGSEHEPCCASGACFGRTTCGPSSQGCVHCGAFNELCCESGNACDSDRTRCNFDAFANTRCLHCGATGEACCESPSGPCDHTQDQCVENPSGGNPVTYCCPPGQNCTAATPGRNLCNEEIHQGGDADEDFDIEMGATSGTLTYRFNLFCVPDDLVVTYEGALLDDTLCNGTSLTPNYCIPPYCCDGSGWCSRSLTFGPGSSTKLHVHVQANCLGSVPDHCGDSSTQWAFSLGCPAH